MTTKLLATLKRENKINMELILYVVPRLIRLKKKSYVAAAAIELMLEDLWCHIPQN